MRIAGLTNMNEDISARMDNMVQKTGFKFYDIPLRAGIKGIAKYGNDTLGGVHVLLQVSKEDGSEFTGTSIAIGNIPVGSIPNLEVQAETVGAFLASSGGMRGTMVRVYINSTGSVMLYHRREQYAFTCFCYRRKRHLQIHSMGSK